MFQQKWLALLSVGVLSLGLAGCGTSASVSTTSSAPATSSSTSTAHHHKKAKKPANRVVAHGKIANLSATTIGITNKKGKTITFALTSTTKYKQKKTTIAASALKVGQTATVVGKKTSGNPTALVVRIP